MAFTIGRVYIYFLATQLPLARAAGLVARPDFATTLAMGIAIASPFECHGRAREKGNTFRQQPQVAKREKGKGTRQRRVFPGLTPPALKEGKGTKINKFISRFSNFSFVNFSQRSRS